MPGFFELEGAPEPKFKQDWTTNYLSEIDTLLNSKAIFDRGDIKIFDVLEEKLNLDFQFSNKSEYNLPSFLEEELPKATVVFSNEIDTLANWATSTETLNPSNDELLVLIGIESNSSNLSKTIHLWQKGGNDLNKSLEGPSKYYYKELTANDFELLKRVIAIGKLEFISFLKWMTSGLGNWLDWLMEQITENFLQYIIDFLGKNAMSSREFWNPDLRGGTPNGVLEFIDWVGNKINLIKPVIDWGRRFLGSVKNWAEWLGETLDIRRGKEIVSIIEFLGKPLDLLSFLLGETQLILNEIRSNKTIQQSIEFGVAFVCGIWDAFIDLIRGLLSILKLLIVSQNAIYKGVAEAIVNPFNILKKILPLLGNIIVKIISINWFEVFIYIITVPYKFGSFLIDILKDLKEEINLAEIGYWSGYIIFNVLEFFFPISKLAKITKANKLLNPLKETSGRLGLSNRLNNISEVSNEVIVKILKDVERLLKNGTVSIMKIADEFWDALRRWLSQTAGKLYGFSHLGLKGLRISGLILKKLKKSGGNQKTFGLFDISGKLLVSGSKKEIDDYLRSALSLKGRGVQMKLGKHRIEIAKKLVEIKTRGIIYKGRLVAYGNESEMAIVVSKLDVIIGQKFATIKLGGYLKKGRKGMSGKPKEYHSLFYEGKEIFRGSLSDISKLKEEISLVGKKDLKKWLDKYEEISYFRLNNKFPRHNEIISDTGTVTTLVSNSGETVFGLNTTFERILNNGKGLYTNRKNAFELVKKYFNNPKSWSVAQFLTHAEADALLKVTVHESKMVIYVDRVTCGPCQNFGNKGLEGLMKELGIKELIIYNNKSLKPIKLPKKKN